MANSLPHGDFERLVQRARSLRASSKGWEGIIYRSVSPTFSGNSEITSGVGSAIHGGRWNPVGVKAVYGSFTPEGAMAEVLKQARYYGLSPARMMPRLFVAVEVKVSLVLDLREGAVRRSLRISKEGLIGEDWRRLPSGGESRTQAVARAAIAAGFEGLFAPSAASADAETFVVFVDHLKKGSRVVVAAGGEN